LSAKGVHACQLLLLPDVLVYNGVGNYKLSAVDLSTSTSHMIHYKIFRFASGSTAQSGLMLLSLLSKLGDKSVFILVLDQTCCVYDDVEIINYEWNDPTRIALTLSDSGLFKLSNVLQGVLFYISSILARIMILHNVLLLLKNA
jgi:hypothetical protein